MLQIGSMASGWKLLQGCASGEASKKAQFGELLGLLSWMELLRIPRTFVLHWSLVFGPCPLQPERLDFPKASFQAMEKDGTITGSQSSESTCKSSKPWKGSSTACRTWGTIAWTLATYASTSHFMRKKFSFVYVTIFKTSVILWWILFLFYSRVKI